MTDIAPAHSTPWFREIDRNQWRTLLASNLGWLFDGFETYALVLTAGPAMRSILARPRRSAAEGSHRCTAVP